MPTDRAQRFLILEEIDDDGRLPWLFLPLWVLSAYVLLPRLNRLLTGIYVQRANSRFDDLTRDLTKEIV